MSHCDILTGVSCAFYKADLLRRSKNTAIFKIGSNEVCFSLQMLHMTEKVAGNGSLFYFYDFALQ